MAVRDALSDGEGRGVRELARRTGFSPTSVLHALRRLEATGAVMRLAFGNSHLFLLAGPGHRRVPGHLEALHALLVSRGRLTPAHAVSAFSEVPAVTTRHRLGQLLRLGFASCHRDGNRLTYMPRQ